MSILVRAVRRVVWLVQSLHLVATLAVVLLGFAAVIAVFVGPSAREPESSRTAPQAPRAVRTVVLDAGHQLGNGHFAREISHRVDDGAGATKACNTTGTATDAGYPEATFAFEVTQLVAEKLRSAGVTVVLTRSTNEEGRWGPCVDERGLVGNELPDGGRADLKLSVHGDGCDGCGAGFHVLTAGPGGSGGAAGSGATGPDGLAARSRAFGEELRARLAGTDLPPAPYAGDGSGLVERSDLATLNLSRMPSAMVELGNMRDPDDVLRMTTEAGRRRYADALADAVLAYLR